MLAYRRIAAASFRQYSTYRMATAAGVFTNTIFGFIRASIMLAAIGTAGGELSGYDALQAATYVWLGQALLAPIEVFGTRELALRIRQGDVAIDLLRPVDLLGQLYAAKLGRSAYLLLARGVASHRFSTDKNHFHVSCCLSTRPYKHRQNYAQGSLCHFSNYF